MPRKPRYAYDHVWRKLRLKILERDRWICYEPSCTARATTVDHIIPVAEAPHLRLDPTNLRASCGPHNYGRPQARLARMAKINRSRSSVREW